MPFVFISQNLNYHLIIYAQTLILISINQPNGRIFKVEDGLFNFFPLIP